MKQIYTLSIALVITLASFARPVIKATTWYGNWSTASNWNLNRVPTDGDSIVIEGGRGIIVDKPINLNNVYIKVIGNNSYIHLKGKLNLDDASFVEIGMGARIMAFGANRNAETITIGGVRKFDQNSNSNMYGYGIASKYTGVAPSGFSSNMAEALPVVFTSFVAAKQASAVVLTWATAQEKDNSRFEVEKSTDGRTWNVLAVVFGNGTTTQAQQYTYTDKSAAAAVSYYRIRQVDTDGKSVYTAVKTIRAEEAKKEATIYAASKNTINIDLNNNTKKDLQVTVLNLNGQVIAKQVYNAASYRVSMQIPSVSNGMYVVVVNDNNGWNETKKIVF